MAISLSVHLHTIEVHGSVVVACNEQIGSFDRSTYRVLTKKTKKCKEEREAHTRQRGLRKIF